MYLIFIGLVLFESMISPCNFMVQETKSQEGFI